MRGAHRVAIWMGVVIALAAAALMASAAAAATFVYVGNAESNEIYVLQLRPQNGDLTVVDKTPIPGIEKPGISTPMSVSPDRRILYVGTRGEPKIAAGFTIDQATGKLTFVSAGPLADSLAYIAVDRTGRYLLGASYPGHRVTVNPIEAPGRVGRPQQVLENHPNAHSILADAANRFVLVPTLGNDRVNQFAFDASTGKLTPTASPAAETRPKAGPRHLVYHPGGKLVYVNGETDGNVYVFDYNTATGDLKQKQVVSALPAGFTGKPSTADMHITPDGKFLYVSERTSSTLAGFQVDGASGTLTPIGSVPTEKQPRGFHIDPSGRYLAAVGELSDSMTVYAIDQGSGALTRLNSYATGKKPNWVEFLNLP